MRMQISENWNKVKNYKKYNNIMHADVRIYTCSEHAIRTQMAEFTPLHPSSPSSRHYVFQLGVPSLFFANRNLLITRMQSSISIAKRYWKFKVYRVTHEFMRNRFTKIICNESMNGKLHQRILEQQQRKKTHTKMYIEYTSHRRPAAKELEYNSVKLNEWVNLIDGIYSISKFLHHFARSREVFAQPRLGSFTKI